MNNKFNINGSLTTTGDINIQGNLNVKGTTSTVNQETLTIKDNLIAVNSDGTSLATTEVAGTVIVDGGEVFVLNTGNYKFNTNKLIELLDIKAVDDGYGSHYLEFSAEAVNKFNSLNLSGETQNGRLGQICLTADMYSVTLLDTQYLLWYSLVEFKNYETGEFYEPPTLIEIFTFENLLVTKDNLEFLCSFLEKEDGSSLTIADFSTKATAYAAPIYNSYTDTLKIGLGTYEKDKDTNNIISFTFGAGQGQSIATRDDAIPNNSVVKWNDKCKVLEKTPITCTNDAVAVEGSLKTNTLNVTDNFITINKDNASNMGIITISGDDTTYLQNDSYLVNAEKLLIDFDNYTERLTKFNNLKLYIDSTTSSNSDWGCSGYLTIDEYNNYYNGYGGLELAVKDPSYPGWYSTVVFLGLIDYNQKALIDIPFNPVGSASGEPIVLENQTLSTEDIAFIKEFLTTTNGDPIDDSYFTTTADAYASPLYDTTKKLLKAGFGTVEKDGAGNVTNFTFKTNEERCITVHDDDIPNNSALFWDENANKIVSKNGIEVISYGDSHYLVSKGGFFPDSNLLTGLDNGALYLNGGTFQHQTSTGDITWNRQIGGDGFIQETIATKEWTTANEKYHTPAHSSGIKLATGTNVSDLYVPTGTTASTVALGNHTHAIPNAFSNIKVGSTTVSAETLADTVEFVGSNITITPDATNDKVTFSVANGSTSTKGIVQLENAYDSPSTTTAATPSAVKAAYDKANHTHPYLSNTTKYAGSSAQGGSANSAVKLATARTIALDTGVTGTATSFDGSANITIPVTGIKESYLTWGGKNLTDGYGPIDAAMISQLGANRLAFFKPENVTLEYSTDKGSTWSTVEDTIIKRGLFSIGVPFYIGNNSSTGIDKSNYQGRITITTTGASCYSTLNKFAIYLSTEGSTGCYVSIDARTKANQDANSNTWVNFANKVDVRGWSGWNIINTSGITTHGNTTSQYSQIRFTFGVTSHASTVTSKGLYISKIMGFGGVGWSTPSNMAKDGHLYSYDATQNATFPGNVSVASGKKFIGNLDGAAAKLANTSAIGSTTKPVYFTASGVPAACTYSLNKTVPSNAIFTDNNVTNTLATTTKAYITGTTSATTSTGTLIFDTGVYLDTTAGQLVATKFKGDLIGNADTATKATQDSSGNNIINTYATKTELDQKAPMNHAISMDIYGLSDASVYGHARASSTIPKSNGSATAGTETSSFARGDHVHPLQTSVTGSSGSCTGNAATASKLKTARTIGGVSFDGSANIDLPGVNTAGNQNTSGNAATATTASKLSNTSAIGSTTNPVYFTANGVPAACTYSLNKTVPSDAVFTDTKVTQNAVTSVDSTNKDLPVILAYNDSGSAQTATVNKSSKLLFNPSTGALTATVMSASTMNATVFVATSDRRLKENIIEYKSEKSILDLPVYKYNFISDENKKEHIGCLAQDLQEICPEIVNEDKDGYLSIQESKIIYLLLEEVKKLKQEVDILTSKN